MALFETTALSFQRKSLPLVPRCWLCKLDKGCESPKMKPTGRGGKGILIVGEAPGAEEDRRNRQFVGKTGQLLRRTLSELGVEPDRDCWFDNAIMCRPRDNKIKDEKAIDHCRPHLISVIRELKPKVVILLGRRPVRSLIGHLWKEDTGGIGRWAGFRIPCRDPNAWVCPTWHPSYLLREEENPNYRVLRMYWRKHLEWALTRKEQPWKTVPDYAKQVTIGRNPLSAAAMLRERFITHKLGPIAFDYETNMLKPDSALAKIVCCSVSDGATTIAFPWIGEAVKAMREFIRSPIPKIGANKKFEERWTMKVFGHGVRNWVKDGDVVENAHILDTRKGVKSVKFNAFVLLGQEGYDSAVKPFLKSKDGTSNGVNRIDEVPMADLLAYCGMDSLMEFLIYERQKEMFGGLS